MNFNHFPSKQILHWKYVGMIIMLAFIFLLGYTYVNFATSDSNVVAIDIPEVAEAAPPIEWIPELPVRLVISAIEVDAEVQYVGLDQSGTGEMGVPSNFTDVAWYKDGVRPGMRGSAVIAGHYNGKDTPEAVFYDLSNLQIGDEVIIMSAERIEDIFRVVKVETYAYDGPTTDVFISTDGKKRLNLITCGGGWLSEEGTYNERTVVFTELLTDVE
jgi:hypothetical protein